jgi:NAD(P)-dependent dehydrogenase (short-subunit alcohol dehydrogenase family)
LVSDDAALGIAPSTVDREVRFVPREAGMARLKSFLDASRRRLRRTYDLRAKAVLISGGSRGLGLALAREFARAGARLALVARDADELVRARDDLRARGAAEVIIEPCDVADGDEVTRAVVSIMASLGTVDVLVNVAGTIEVGPIEAMRKEDFERALATNFWGAFHLMDAVVPEMRARGQGRVANVSSIGGIVAVPHLLPYVASKFALTGLSLGLRAELAKDGIGVSTICPGLMRTGSPVNARFKGDHSREYAWFATADSLPILSTSAEAAARRIVRAVVRNEAMVRITAPAKLAAIAAGLTPGLVSAAMSLTNSLLPRSDARPPVRGRASALGSAVRWLTAPTAWAAADKNEQRA